MLTIYYLLSTITNFVLNTKANKTNKQQQQQQRCFEYIITGFFYDTQSFVGCRKIILFYFLSQFYLILFLFLYSLTHMYRDIKTKFMFLILLFK